MGSSSDSRPKYKGVLQKERNRIWLHPRCCRNLRQSLPRLGSQICCNVIWKAADYLKGLFYTLILFLAHFASAEESNRSSIFWMDGKYLFWSIQTNPIPAPLLTNASDSDPLPGAIGQPGTHVLIGQEHFGMGWINGFQAEMGGVVNQRFAVEGRYFLLPTIVKKRSFNTSGEPGSQNYAVPIFDVTGVCGLNGVPGETIFILPGPLSGEPGFAGVFDFRFQSKIQGVEFNGLYSCLERDRLNLIGGFRWLQLHESLIFKGDTHTVPNVSFPQAFFNFSDRFFTWNDFLATQFGINGTYERKSWKWEGDFRGAIGAVLEQLKIKGSSQTSSGNLFFETAGTSNDILSGGIFAEPTNHGTHKRWAFAYAFEARGSVGYQIFRHLEINLGYTFLWLSQVLRSGKQIDRKINTTLTTLADVSRNTVGVGPGPIPFGTPAGAPAPRGPQRPTSSFQRSSFYAQGLDAGIVLKF